MLGPAYTMGIQPTDQRLTSPSRPCLVALQLPARADMRDTGGSPACQAPRAALQSDAPVALFGNIEGFHQTLYW